MFGSGMLSIFAQAFSASLQFRLFLSYMKLFLLSSDELGWFPDSQSEI